MARAFSDYLETTVDILYNKANIFSKEFIVSIWPYTSTEKDINGSNMHEHLEIDETLP